MNKKEIKIKWSEYKVSKCCGEEAGVCFMQDGMTFDSWVCSKCNKVCDLIDLGEWFEENYISKAEVKEKIKNMIETKLSYNPNFAVHPGESLKNEMEFLHLSQVELSQRTGLSEKCISQIVNGVAPITSDTAIKLELALGTPAIFWNNLQKNYDLNMARIALEERLKGLKE